MPANATSKALSRDDFDFIAGFLKKRSGLALTQDKLYLLENRLEPLAQANGMRDLGDLIARLRAGATSTALLTEITEAMTTNESMFFRDQKPFDQLKKVVLPDLKQQGKLSLRLWSAACSNGQEPYSTAMLMKEEAHQFPGMQLEIYATDIAEKVLDRARAGHYTQFEVQRGLPIQFLMKYFVQRPGNCWEINEAIKSSVRFSKANLLEQYHAHGKFDIIMCRNVLIYFDEPTKSDVLNRMAKIMHPRGYLFLGASETIIGLTDAFRPVEGHTGLFQLV
jgi:chemotaxis protein methyltransferase CheR